MKKMIFAALATAAIISSSAVVAAGYYSERAVLSPNVSIVIDNDKRTFYSAQGKELKPILYKGTTYIPLRAIGEIMGKNVNWDNTSKTVELSGTRQTASVVGTPDATIKESEVKLDVHPEYHVVIDGSERSFFDVDGKSVAPVVYEGSIYLPIRSIGEIMGKTVSWDKNTKTVTLLGGEVTDYDTTGSTTTTPGTGTTTTPSTGTTTTPGTGTTPSTTTTNITLEKAKNIALNNAGKTASQVTFVEAKQDYEKGVLVYEIEFVSLENGVYKEYDYEIEASSGKILSYDFDAEHYKPSTNNSTASVSESSIKKTVLAKVPGATEANIIEFKKDYDDGRLEYEGEIVYNYTKYEFEVDGQTGAITKWEID